MYRFEDYDLIIDARSEREYAEDHIPGAINLPVVRNDEYAEVGTFVQELTSRLVYGQFDAERFQAARFC